MRTTQYTITQLDMQNNVQAQTQTGIPIQNKNTNTHSELRMLVEGMNPVQLRSLTLTTTLQCYTCSQAKPTQNTYMGYSTSESMNQNEKL